MNKKIRIERVKSALNDFSSIKLDDISKIYKHKNIKVMADELKYNYAFYNKENKVVVINKEFVRSDRNDLELAYILLHEFFHVYEQKDASLSKTSTFNEDADMYAKLVFKNNNTKLPSRFE